MRAERTNPADVLSDLLDKLCRFLVGAGGLVAVGAIGLIVYQFMAGGSVQDQALAQGVQTVGALSTAALVGCIAVALGVAWLAWGEEVLGPILLIVWALLFFSSSYLPLMTGTTTPNALQDEALSSLGRASIPFGVVGILVIALDIAGRIRTRAREGAKADQLKYGKGLKEERDVRNVFLGKCWQLPYCRKFVRERCPIYHSRRTCWKERVGCMCEESVIRNAMEGRVIPADIVAAAKYIPYNSKLNPEQKAERCRQCVIYNEHQKHKYKLGLPVAVGGVALVYVLFREPMGNGVKGAIKGADELVARATLRKDSGDPTRSGLGDPTIPYHEIILAVIAFIVACYSIRAVEFLFFKLKV